MMQNLVTATPADGGILYTETNLSRTFPEPLNAATSCLFLAIAIYWSLILWAKFRQHTFLSFCLMLLYIGGIGGTVYHGLRRWRIFIYMDWMPIMFLCILAGLYFMLRLVKWYYAAAVVALYMAFQLFGRSWFSGGVQLFININYAVMASIVLLPVLLFLHKNSWQHGHWVGFALLAFCMALFFRVADKWGLFASGTHFLWHSFGAVAAFCMFRFIYMLNEKPPIRPFAAG